ncbi:MAG: hypothetical protein WCP73_00175 [Eubacteriales bacterium]
MQISSINSYDSFFTKVSQLYGNTSQKTNQASSSVSGSNTSTTDQMDLSEDYMNFLDKVKNGTVSDDDLTKMADEMSSSQIQMPPPPPMQMTGTGSSESTDAIGSFLDKVKNGTVTSDDLTNMESVLANIGSSSSVDSNTVSSTNSSSSEITFQSFMDKVKNGTVTDDDLTQMKSLLETMDQKGTQGTQNRPSMPPPPLGMMGFGESDDSSDSTDSVNSLGTSTVSSTSSSDSANSLTLQSFLDKVKNGTVSDEDLTKMQSILEEMSQNSTQGTQNRPPMPPPMGMMGFGESDSSTSSSTSAVSSSSSDSTDSLSLQSFLDKVKNGTVSKDDLTQMQSIMESWLSSDSSDSSSTYAQAYDL